MERLCLPALLEGLRHCRKADCRRFPIDCICVTLTLTLTQVVGVGQTNYDYSVLLSYPLFKFKQCCYRQCLHYGIYSDKKKHTQCGQFMRKSSHPASQMSILMNYYCRKNLSVHWTE